MSGCDNATRCNAMQYCYSGMLVGHMLLCMHMQFHHADIQASAVNHSTAQHGSISSAIVTPFATHAWDLLSQSLRSDA